jgi:16S rRNA (guanine527-N7)-methyltransferase
VILPELVRSVGPLVAEQGGAPEGWADQLEAYLAHLREMNRQVNLVSRASIDQLVEKQLVPSLATLLVVPRGAAPRVLDVGTGGGFPGIPLKILRPTIRLDLVDATRKKCDFLRIVVSRLALPDVEVHWCRAEEPTPELLSRAPFDLLVARAVGTPRVLRVAARRLLAPTGTGWRFVAPHGQSADLAWPSHGVAVTSLRRI